MSLHPVLPTDRPRVRLDFVSVAGSPEQENEDTFAIKELEDGFLLGVFDGMTALDRQACDDVSAGSYAAAFLRDRLLEATAAEIGDLRHLLAAWNTRLGASLSALGNLPIQARPAASATVVHVDLAVRSAHIAHVYDSFCIARFKNGASAKITSDRNRAFDRQVLALMDEVARERGIPMPQARDDPRIQQALRDSRTSKLNRADGAGAGAINGDPHVARYIEGVSLPLLELDALLLGTDGLVPQGWDLDDAEVRETLLRMACDEGVSSIIRAKRRSEDSDPGWAHWRFKHSDDATAVLAVFSSDLA